MSSVHHVADRSDFASLTTVFLDSAAAIETRLYNAERQIQSLQRELRRAQDRQTRVRKWIVTLRQSHRTQSHAKTAGLFKVALEAFDTMAQVDLEPVTTPNSLFHDAIAS